MVAPSGQPEPSVPESCVSPTGGRMSWTEAYGTTRCYANNKVSIGWRTPRCSTAPRMRRLPRCRQWAK
eukprot:8968629-Pyramimonas_sp.AAC.1